MISIYDNFPTFATNVFNYLLKSPEVMLLLIGVFILYFGYYSTRYKPIRTEKLHLYLSGFKFLSMYIGIQIFCLYVLRILLPKYFHISITPLAVTCVLLLLLLFILFIYVLGKIKCRGVLKLVITIGFFAFLYIFRSAIWNYMLGLENIKWITYFLILYHATMVIIAVDFKKDINRNSYAYEDFYSKVTKMNLLSGSIFSYFVREAQRDWFDKFFSKNKTNNDKKEVSEESEIKSSEKNDNIALFQVFKQTLRQKLSSRQWKEFGLKLQSLVSQSETWFNSLLILAFIYVTFTYAGVSLAFGLVLMAYLFFALTRVAIEYSIYTNGFLLIKVFPKVGKPFKCRLMELNEKLITVVRKGKKENKDFNPLEHYPLTEISKIRYISRGEMLDEI